MMFDKVVDPGTLGATGDGFRVGVRVPWYRALPLSTIDIGPLIIDGHEVAPDRIRFELNGESWTLAGMQTLSDRMWFITDTAWLLASGYPVEAGSEHEVTATVGIRPPYIKGLRRIGRATHKMRAA